MFPTAASGRPVRRAAGLGLTLGAVGLVASVLPVTFVLEELLGLGLLFTTRGPVVPPQEVVVVGIARDAARALGQTTELDTWPRDLHAQLVDRLTAAGASAIAFDLWFGEPRAAPATPCLPRRSSERATSCCFEETDSEVVSLGRPVDRLVRDQDSAPPGVQGTGAGLGAVHPADRPLARKPVVGIRSRDRRQAVATGPCSASSSVAVLRGLRALARASEARLDGGVAAEPRRRPDPRQPRADRAYDAANAARTMRRCEPPRAPSCGAPTTRQPTSTALETLLDVYSGASSRYLNFYGPARAIETIPYDRALRGGELDLTGQGGAGRGVGAAAAAAAGRLSSPYSRRTPVSISAASRSERRRWQICSSAAR